MMAKALNTRKKAIEDYKAYRAEYIRLLKKNKVTIQERDAKEAELRKLNDKLKTHDAKLKDIKNKYDPNNDLVTKDDLEEWSKEVPDRKVLKKDDRRKIIQKKLEGFAVDEMVSFPQVKAWLAEASRTNGPNDVNVLETQTGIPATAWKDAGRRKEMNAGKLEGFVQ